MSKNKTENLVKSKKRIRDHGEVFTPQYIVKEMLDIPDKSIIESPRSTILEPSIGEGAFFLEVINRRFNKLVEESYGQTEFENRFLLSITTLYGIELLTDNATECRKILSKHFEELYRKHCNERKWVVKDSVVTSAGKIIEENIVQGNFLTMLKPDGDTISFTEWIVLEKEMSKDSPELKKVRYTMEEIIAKKNESEKVLNRQHSLLDFIDDESYDGTVIEGNFALNNL